MLLEDLSEYYEKLEGTSSRLSLIDILTEVYKKAEKKEVKSITYMTQGLLGPPFSSLNIGVAEKFAEEAIARATGHNKEEVIASFKKTGDLGLTAEELAKKTKLRRMRNDKLNVADVYETMLKIAKTSGSGSQDVKIRHLVELLSASNPLGNRYVVRYALGELRLGVGDATILEALSKAYTGERSFKAELEGAYNKCGDLGRVGETIAEKGEEGIKKFKVLLFSPIRPQLAERLPTSEEILKRMGGRCAVESKYDGIRVQVHLDKKEKKVEIFSRNLELLTPMFPEIAKASLSEVDAHQAILEGEAIAYNEATEQFRSFQETMQRKRKHGIDELSTTMPLTMFAFDLIYLDGDDYLDKPYEERRKKLDSIIRKNGKIRPSDMITATKPEQLDKYFEEMIEKGLEGIIAKDLNAKYIAGARKFSWIKLKRSYKGELSDTLDLAIVGYYLGRGQRAEFKFGGLLGAVYNEKRDLFETITRIGTGFTEEHMKNFSELLERIKMKNKPARVDSLITPDFWVDPKYVVEVRADEITKSPMHTCGRYFGDKDEGTGYALRFPRIVSDGVRKDKKPEDATTTNEVIEMFKMQKKKKVDEK